MSKPRPNGDQDLAEIVGRAASRPFRKWLVVAVVLVAAGGTGWSLASRNKSGPPEPEYATSPVSRGDISLIVTAAGNLAPTNQIIVGSELSGTVEEIYVDTNDTVKKDQPLLRLDTSKLDQQTGRSRASLLSAQARVSQAEATLLESKAALARQEELLKISGGKTPSRAAMETSRATVARAEADLESARATVVGAEAEVRSFESDLEKALIRSPVDGMVLARSIEIGQTVAASFTAPTLFTIAEDLKKMELRVSVSEADIGRIEPGQPATFSVDAWPGREYRATVTKVAFGSESAATGTGGAAAPASTGVVTYSTELEVANEDLSLRPGMTATVDIAIASREDVVVVPNAALRFDPVAAAAVGKPEEADRTLVESLAPGRRWRGMNQARPGAASSDPNVWVLENGKPVEVKVKPGITDGRVTEILDDSLSPGTPVILSLKPVATE